MKADAALKFWQEKNLLTAEKARELKQALPDDMDVSHKAIGIFSAVGAVLVGLGIILFIASNWQAMTPTIKVAILLAGMIATAVAGYSLAFEQKTYPMTGLALLLINIFLYGASIFLIGQIYHLPLDWSTGMFYWFLGVAVFGYVLQSRLHVWIAVPILLLTLSWFSASVRTGGSEFEALFDDTGLLVLYPILGVGLLSLGILHRLHSWLKFSERTLMHWGLFLLTLVMVVSTTERSVFFGFFQLRTDWFALSVLAASLLALIAALVWGKFETPQGRYGLLALALYLVFTFALARVPLWMGYPAFTNLVYGAPAWVYAPDVSSLIALFVVHIVMVFIFLLVVIWEGTLLKSPQFVNIGMLGLAFGVFIQYFSWAFEQLDRSVAFILGGVLILGLSTVLERQRRRILLSLKS
jgi:uncharacterized membrane protein